MPVNIYSNDWIKEVTKLDPIVQLEKIIIGYRHYKNFQEIKKSLKDGFVEKNGFSIEIELSPISEAFKW